MGRRLRRAASSRAGQRALSSEQLQYAQEMNAIWARMDSIPKGWTESEYKPVVVSEYVTPRGAPRNVDDRRRGALDPTVRRSREPYAGHGGEPSAGRAPSAGRSGSAPRGGQFAPEQESIIGVREKNGGLLEIYRNPDGSLFCVPSDQPPGTSQRHVMALKKGRRFDMPTSQVAALTPARAKAMPPEIYRRWRNVVANSAALVDMTPGQWLARHENASPADVYALYADAHDSPMHRMPAMRKESDMTPENVLKIVQKNGRSLAGVPEGARTKEVCMAALTSKRPALFRDVPKHLQREVGQDIIALMKAGKSVPMTVQTQLSWSWQKVFPDQAKPDVLVRSLASRSGAPKAQASAGNGRTRRQGQSGQRGQAPQSRPAGRRPGPLVPVVRSVPVKTWDQAHAQAFDNSGLAAAADDSAIRHMQHEEGMAPMA